MADASFAQWARKNTPIHVGGLYLVQQKPKSIGCKYYPENTKVDVWIAKSQLLAADYEEEGIASTGESLIYELEHDPSAVMLDEYIWVSLSAWLIQRFTWLDKDKTPMEKYKGALRVIPKDRKNPQKKTSWEDAIASLDRIDKLDKTRRKAR